MTREEYIKELIKDRGKNIKEFSTEIGIPYTTMLSMLKNLGGAAVDNIIKICTIKPLFFVRCYKVKKLLQKVLTIYHK